MAAERVKLANDLYRAIEGHEPMQKIRKLFQQRQNFPTLLRQAVRSKYLEAVIFLLENGADAKEGGLLADALKKKKDSIVPAIVTALVKAGADPNSEINKHGQQALYVLLQNHPTWGFKLTNPGNEPGEFNRAVKTLVTHGADTDYINLTYVFGGQPPIKETALEYLCGISGDNNDGDDIKLVKMLLKAGADPNANNPLNAAANNDSENGLRKVKLLVAAGANRADITFTPVRYAGGGAGGNYGPTHTWLKSTQFKTLDEIAEIEKGDFEKMLAFKRYVLRAFITKAGEVRLKEAHGRDYTQVLPFDVVEKIRKLVEHD